MHDHEPTAPQPAPETEPETLRLVREAKGGDTGSFGALYEKIAPALYTWADLRIRKEFRQHVSPEDVVQEVWCRAWKIFEKFDPDNGSFRYWIFRVAKNVLYEALRVLKDPGTSPGYPGVQGTGSPPSCPCKRAGGLQRRRRTAATAGPPALPSPGGEQ